MPTLLAMRIATTIILLLISVSAQAQDVLSTLRKQHPRLLVLSDDFKHAREVAQSDPHAKVYYNQITSDSTKFLDQPPVNRGRGDMLNTSRTALGRISFLAAKYRMDGDRRFADRAREEMLAIAKFDDWNPSHFLDVAEMTAAISIGYDWLFDAISPEDRITIRDAIIEKGLKPGLTAYQSGAWWTKVNHNWANVCAGGLALGALAIAAEEPDLARQILNASRKSLDKPMSQFAPDGGWVEGPGYWNYCTRYTVFYAAAAQTALGNDLGISEFEGFDKTGFFRIHTTGPTGVAFDFADCAEFPGNASQMFWLSRQFNEPDFAIAERGFASKWGDVFHLLWFDDRGSTLADAKLPLDAYFKNVDVACFRSAWEDRDAFYVGFKGGDNSANHAHLDLGSFVMDAFGERWAMDLGSDSYNLPQYFGKLRWSYYRTDTEGHNTLLINDANQDASAKAPIIAYASAPDRAFAIADLSQGYHWAGAKVRRGIELLHRNTVIVEDEVEAKEPVKVQWNMHTLAGIEISNDKQSAKLVQKDKSLVAKILSPQGARFEIVGASPPKPQNPNKGVSNLVVRLPDKVTSTRIVVVLAAKERAEAIHDVPALDGWR